MFSNREYPTAMTSYSIWITYYSLIGSITFEEKKKSKILRFTWLFRLAINMGLGGKLGRDNRVSHKFQ